MEVEVNEFIFWLIEVWSDLPSLVGFVFLTGYLTRGAGFSINDALQLRFRDFKFLVMFSCIALIWSFTWGFVLHVAGRALGVSP